jgi:hypothetical protein
MGCWFVLNPFAPVNALSPSVTQFRFNMHKYILATIVGLFMGGPVLADANLEALIEQKIKDCEPSIEVQTLLLQSLLSKDGPKVGDTSAEDTTRKVARNRANAQPEKASVYLAIGDSLAKNLIAAKSAAWYFSQPNLKAPDVRMRGWLLAVCLTEIEPSKIYAAARSVARICQKTQDEVEAATCAINALDATGNL